MIVDPYVQEWVAGTNGRMYRPLVNKLQRYPIPTFPLAAHNNQLLLDIGCGWGRWMVSASRKGYVPIGMDIKVDAAQAARRVIQVHNVGGYVVAADLRTLPFKSRTFDIVFSYSTLQHVHKRRVFSCLEEVHRVLKDDGICILEFPTKYGLGNVIRGTSWSNRDEHNYDSWCVRYYTIIELHTLFAEIFGNFRLRPDCYLGIGVQPSDMDMLPWRYRPVVVGSEVLKALSRVFPFLKSLADSVFVLATKTVESGYAFQNRSASG